MTKIKNMENMILKMEKEIMSRKKGDWRGKKGLEVDQGVVLEQVRVFYSVLIGILDIDKFG